MVVVGQCMAAAAIVLLGAYIMYMDCMLCVQVVQRVRDILSSQRPATGTTPPGEQLVRL